MIVEVLSPSTETYDREGKFLSYQTLESLQEYVLVSQHNVHVEQYVRQGNEWILQEFHSLEDVLKMASIECQLAIHAIYAKVKFAR